MINKFHRENNLPDFVREKIAKFEDERIQGEENYEVDLKSLALIRTINNHSASLLYKFDLNDEKSDAVQV